MKLENRHVILTDKEKQNPKLITGVKLGAILGKNEYTSPFKCWCDMLHVWVEPFKDTKYTLAGKIIEPKQAEYIKNNYSQNIVYPKDLYGENYFSKMKGNFFKDQHFGGMWDYLNIINDNIDCVFEMKTATKSKKEDWNNKIPESYALQASLYAWLLGIDKVVMVVTFLDSKNGDYDNPEQVIVNSFNTQINEFYVSEKFPNFEETCIKPALHWWDDYIKTGISPEFDPIQDNDIITDLQFMQNRLELEEKNKVCDFLYIKKLDELMIAIQNDLLGKPLVDINLLKNYYFELSIAIYFLTCKAVDFNDIAGKEKLEAAKLMLKTLETLILTFNIPVKL